jgi:pimeloyl-ACP methyl ester carboxylesterase
MQKLQELKTSLAWLRAFFSYEAWMLRERPRESSGRAEISDISMFFRRYGAGEPVLLLHGGFAYAEAWAGLIPVLARHYQVLAPDSRGHGRTTLGEQPLTYRRMAADVIALSEALGLGPAHLVGWSDGGCTSLAVALERPDLVRSLFLLGTPFSTDNYSPESQRLIEEFLRPTSMTVLTMRAFRRAVSPDPQNGLLFLERMARMWNELPDFTVEELRRITAPTLVVACDRDEYLSGWEDPLKVFKETAAAIPGARLATIPGGTHSVILERPKEVNRLLLDFLREV